MATVICMDGLGGHPKTTFGGLKKVLQTHGHNVMLLDTSEIRSHEDRVTQIIQKLEEHPNRDVFLIGQSAGGSAIRIVAERMEKQGKPLNGVIMLSPAMPLGVLFLTWTLVRVMARRICEILSGKTIIPTEEEYSALISPVAEKFREEIISSRQEVSGVEARTLAFMPPRFVGYSYPTLLIFGASDKWIAPRAQRRLAKMLEKKSAVSTHCIEGAGHLTLASEKAEKICTLIQKWITTT